MKIRFVNAVPTALHAEIEDLLAPLLPLVDLHVDEIRVSLKGAGSEVEGEAAILVKREYHVAHLWIDPAFFSLEEDEREATLLHEMFHVLVDVYSREVERVVVEFVPEAMHPYVVGVLRDSEEHLVNSLTISFERLHERLTAARALVKVESVAIKDFYEDAITA